MNDPGGRLSLPNRGVECPECEGAGFVYYAEGPGGKNRQAGVCQHIEKLCVCGAQPPFMVYSERLNAVVPCPCQEARIKLHHIRQQYLDAAIPPRYQWKFLEDFKVDWAPQDSANTELITLLDWADRFIGKYRHREWDKPWMFLYGPTGTGKTLICCVILNELMRRYHADVRYAKISRDFIGAIQASFSKNDELYGQGNTIFRRLQNVDVLVLDDFGTHKDSAFTDAILYDLIDARYEENRLTLFTSNRKPDTFADLGGGRIYSRLQEMAHFIALNYIPDYRTFNKSLHSTPAPRHP